MSLQQNVLQQKFIEKYPDYNIFIASCGHPMNDSEPGFESLILPGSSDKVLFAVAPDFPWEMAAWMQEASQEGLTIIRQVSEVPEVPEVSKVSEVSVA